MRFRTFLLPLALLVPLPGTLLAQVEISARSSSLTIGGRLQPQYQVSSAEGVASDLFLRRARIRVDGSISDFVDARVDVDFAGGGASLKDAWMRMSFSDAFRLSVGQFKRAFTVFELASSTDLPVIERDGRIAGVSTCSGVGSVCSLSRLAQALEFDDRDLGVRMDGRLGGGLSYLATVTNGEGANASDVNDAKSVSGRVVYRTGPLAVAAFGAVHDHLNEAADDTDYARAFGADVELGTWRDGFHLLAAVVAGENWRAGPQADFVSVQALVSRYVDVGRPRLAGVEPMIRVSWADPDRDVADDAGLLLTPGFMAYVAGKNGIAANLDVYRPQGDGDTEFSFKLQTFLYF